MTVTKARKSEQLATLEAHLKEATSVAFTSNQKITVAEVSAMKRELRAQNTLFLTVKKTLIRVAFKNVYDADLDLATLPGQVSLVISKGDKVAGLGIANKFAKEWKKEEKMSFVGGYLDGRLMDATETTKLAGLPSREVLLAKLLGSMKAPISGLARFFDAAKKDLEAKSLAKVGDLTVATPTSEPAPAPVAEAPKAEATPVADATPEASTSETVAESTSETSTPEVAQVEEVKTEESPTA